MSNTPLAILLATIFTLYPAVSTTEQLPRAPIVQQHLSEKDQRGLKLMKDLITEGFSPILAAGFVGNISQESDFKPHISGHSGIGMVQWCGYRKRGLQRFAALRNTAWKCPTLQAKWIVFELTQGTEVEYFPPILKARDPKDAALRISKYYERPKKHRANNSFRASEAERFYRLWLKQFLVQKD